MKIGTLSLAISLITSLAYADMGDLHDDWLDPDWLDPSAESEKTLPEFEGHTKSSLQDTCAYKSANGEKKAEDVKSSQNLGRTANGMPHFRRFVSVLLNLMDEKGVDAGIDFLIHGHLDRIKLQLLRNFSRGQNVGVQEVNLVLEKMITDMSRAGGQYVPPTIVLGLDLSTVQTISICVLSLLLSVWLLVMIIHAPPVSYLKLLLGLVFILLVISTGMEWYQLYENAIAKKLATQAKDMPQECTPEGMTGWMTMKVWARDTFFFADDPCLEYHQAIIVNPIVMASPMQAFATAFTHVIIQPMKMVAGAFGESFKALMQPVPVQWQPFIFIAAIIFSALFLIMVMGYGVNIPLVFSFGPRQKPPALPSGTDLQGMLLQIKDGIAEQKARTEALQKELQSRPLQAIEPPGRRTQDGLPNPVQETHRDNEVKLNNFGGQPNTVDSIGASSTWNLRQ
jgi:hypothetical protein